jgi:CheY-like chemotaxis protein
VIALRVLVADDDHGNADSVASLVRLWGHAVRIAYGSAEALAVAAEFQPQVALADLVMPGFDGDELARQIRKTMGPWPVLIAVTGHGLERDYRESEVSGFDHLLLKPADPEAIEVLLAYAQGRFRKNR